MKALEKFSTIFLFAGLGSFLLAFTVLGLWPSLMTKNIPEGGGLPEEIPENFKVHYANVADYQAALKRGRDIYIKEACWHCHSQYVRPVSKESLYYGLVSVPGEYENDLNRPQLFGTRRVGPDLTREAGEHTNDWHLAHLYEPKSVVPESIMPSYKWYFEQTAEGPRPKQEAIDLVAYLQNLGSWAKNVKTSFYDVNEITLPPIPQ